MEALPSVPPIRPPEKNSTAAANRRRPALDVCESRSLMFDASVIGQSCTGAARDSLGLRKFPPAPAAQAREVQMTALLLALSRHCCAAAEAIRRSRSPACQSRQG